MALINCCEWQKHVSDTTAMCPNCGAPVSNAGVALNTIQATSKTLKIQYLLSILFLAGSFFAMLYAIGTRGTRDPSPAPFYLMFFGVVWFIIVKLRIWWHHPMQ